MPMRGLKMWTNKDEQAGCCDGSCVGVLFVFALNAICVCIYFVILIAAWRLLVQSQVWSLSARSLHVLPVSAQLLSGSFGFLPQFKDMPVRWTVNSKASFGLCARLVWMVVRLSMWPCDDWRLVQCVTLPLPYSSWKRLQETPETLNVARVGVWKGMNLVLLLQY